MHPLHFHAYVAGVCNVGVVELVVYQFELFYTVLEINAFTRFEGCVSLFQHNANI